MKIERWEAVHAAREAEEKNGREGSGTGMQFLGLGSTFYERNVTTKKARREGTLHNGSLRQETLGKRWRRWTRIERIPSIDLHHRSSGEGENAGHELSAL